MLNFIRCKLQDLVSTIISLLSCSSVSSWVALPLAALELETNDVMILANVTDDSSVYYGYVYLILHV